LIQVLLVELTRAVSIAAHHESLVNLVSLPTVSDAAQTSRRGQHCETELHHGRERLETKTQRAKF